MFTPTCEEKVYIRNIKSVQAWSSHSAVLNKCKVVFEWSVIWHLHISPLSIPHVLFASHLLANKIYFLQCFPPAAPTGCRCSDSQVGWWSALQVELLSGPQVDSLPGPPPWILQGPPRRTNKRKKKKMEDKKFIIFSNLKLTACRQMCYMACVKSPPGRNRTVNDAPYPHRASGQPRGQEDSSITEMLQSQSWFTLHVLGKDLPRRQVTSAVAFLWANYSTAVGLCWGHYTKCTLSVLLRLRV